MKKDKYWEQQMKDVQENGIQARGKKEFIAFLEGKRLTLKQSMLAYCYQCMGYYEAGKDCQNEYCPFIAFAPYAGKKEKAKKEGPKKVLTEEHKAKMMAGRKKKGE